MTNYFRQKKGSQLNETLIGFGAESRNRTDTLLLARDFEEHAQKIYIFYKPLYSMLSASLLFLIKNIITTTL